MGSVKLTVSVTAGAVTVVVSVVPGAVSVSVVVEAEAVTVVVSFGPGIVEVVTLVLFWHYALTRTMFSCGSSTHIVDAETVLVQGGACTVVVVVLGLPVAVTVSVTSCNAMNVEQNASAFSASRMASAWLIASRGCKELS